MLFRSHSFPVKCFVYFKTVNPSQIARGFEKDSGTDPISHAVTRKVPSALEGLTTVFEMGTGEHLRYYHRLAIIRKVCNVSPLYNLHQAIETIIFKIDVTGTELALLLRQLAKRAGVNLALYSNVKATVNSVQLNKVSLDTAFDYILKGTKFIWKRIDDTYFVVGWIPLIWSVPKCGIALFLSYRP